MSDDIDLDRIAAAVARRHATADEPPAPFPTQFGSWMAERQEQVRRQWAEEVECRRRAAEADWAAGEPARAERAAKVAVIDEQLAACRAEEQRLFAERGRILNPPAPELESAGHDPGTCIRGHKLKDNERAHMEIAGPGEDGPKVWVPTRCGRCATEEAAADRRAASLLWQRQKEAAKTAPGRG